ncbi:mucin-6-like [Cherax quadricarinatus]
MGLTYTVYIRQMPIRFSSYLADVLSMILTPRAFSLKETQERQPQVAHIDVEPTRLPPVTGTQIVTGEDPALRELSVSLIPEDDFATTTTKREKSKTTVIQPEPESVSEISYMETSTISGYRESFGGFDTSLQDLERLEMQVRSGKYKEPLTGPVGPPPRKTSMVETQFQDPESFSEKNAEVVGASSPEMQVRSVPSPASCKVESSERASGRVQESHRPDAAAHTNQVQYPQSSYVSRAPRSEQSSVSVQQPPLTHVGYSLQSIHTLEQPHATLSAHIGHTPHPTCTTLTSHVPHPTHTTLSSHVSHPTHTTLPSHVPQPTHTTLTSHVPHSTHTTLTSHVSHPTHTTLTSYVPQSTHTTLTSHVPHQTQTTHVSHPSQLTKSIRVSHPSRPAHSALTSHPPHATQSTLASHPPHPSQGTHISYAPHSTHAHHSVHFSDLSYKTHAGKVHSQPLTFSQSSHFYSFPTSLYGQVPQSAQPVDPSSSCVHQTVFSDQAIHTSLPDQYTYASRAVHHVHTYHSPHKISQPHTHSSHAVSAPSACSSNTVESVSSTQDTHTVYTPQYIRHVHDVSPVQTARGVPSLQIRKRVHQSHSAQPDHSVIVSHPGRSAQCTQHLHHSLTTGSTCHDHGSYSVTSGQPSHDTQSTQHTPPTKPAHSSCLVQPSHPTVWRHSWTEGEAKEQRVWTRPDRGSMPRFEYEEMVVSEHTYEGESIRRHEWEGQAEGRSEDGLTRGELASLLKRLEHRTPSEQSLLVAERDEDTLI